MLALVAERKQIASAHPNLVDYEGKRAFMSIYRPEPLPNAGSPIEDVEVRQGLFRLRRRKITRPFLRSSTEAEKRRRAIRIGIPRALNLYSTAPFFRAYFETLGIPLILNVVKSKATMTLSAKPFGCMPSSGVSDGVQSLITELHPSAIYCAVETSGHGAVNFQSRVQMYLFKARRAAQEELNRAHAETGLTEQRVRDYLRCHPRLGSPTYLPLHGSGSSHTAADLVREVGRRQTAGLGARIAASVPAALRPRWARGSASIEHRPTPTQ